MEKANLRVGIRKHLLCY